MVKIETLWLEGISSTSNNYRSPQGLFRAR